MKAAWEVARREMLDNLQTVKIPLAFVLTTVLLVTGVLSLAATHEEDVAAYDLVQDEYAAAERQYSVEALAHRVFAPPNPLSLLVGGPAEAVRESFAAPPIVTNHTAQARQEPLRLRFEPTDLGNVGAGVLSLLAILLSFDAVAGEKERGTLKVLLVNPLSRRDVLLGKYLGAMGSLLVPLAGALLLALVALRLTGVRFGVDDYWRLILIFLFLVLLLSAFVLLGLAVSALTHRSGVAILALLLLWVLLVVGAGSLATFAATAEAHGRTLDDVVVELRVLNEAYEEEESRLRADHDALQAKNATQNGTLGRDDAERLKGLRAELASLPAARAADTEALLAAYFQSREVDFRDAERFASLSPAESYRSLAQALARTDYASVRQRLDEFSTYLREMENQRAEDPDRVSLQSPAFRHAPVERTADLERASPFLLALLAQNVAFFLVALFAFHRYDVR